MKKIFIVLFVLLSIMGKSQTNDFGRITLNAYLSEKLDLPLEAKNQLLTKLNQIATNYGLGGTSSNPRFIITANVNIGTKDIIAGPPQMVSQNIDFVLFIGDAIENKIYSNIRISVKGVGTNENKAFIKAISNLDTKNDNLETFVKEAKNKIIDYYKTNCIQIIESIDSDVNKQDYYQALYKLQLIPNICNDCYQQALKKSDEIYQQKIDFEGQKLLDKAKSIWASSPNAIGANEVLPLLLKINKKSKYYSDIDVFVNKVEAKLASDEIERLKKEAEESKRKYELELEREKNEAELEKVRINAYREIASEYYKNQPLYQYKIYWVY